MKLFLSLYRDTDIFQTVSFSWNINKTGQSFHSSTDRGEFEEKRVTTLTNWHGTPNGDAAVGGIDGPRSLRVINYQPGTTS